MVTRRVTVSGELSLFGTQETRKYNISETGYVFRISDFGLSPKTR
jgi:hypothetical protein